MYAGCEGGRVNENSVTDREVDWLLGTFSPHLSWSLKKPRSDNAIARVQGDWSDGQTQISPGSRKGSRGETYCSR